MTTPSAHRDGQPPLLVVDHISKIFGAVTAIKDITFTINAGQVVALVGDNGAGKSTLVKIISGLFPPTSGRVLLNGAECHFTRPADALHAGIETVYQDLALIEQLDVADNVFLGRETTRFGWIGRLLGILDRDTMRAQTADALADLHIKIPAPTLAVSSMSGGQRQAVAIGRAITWGRKLLILDEPTAALGVEETEQVLQMIEKLRGTAMSQLVISHNMQHVHRISDKIVVLRQGWHVATLTTAETDPQEIVAYITGAKQQTPVAEG
ncbi:MAG: sugar ABC transporter ATP-binding protein [Chloroflexi bacterium]|nr:sugar ABC transporter ATP-binding protein [Chloroflexota bacterium]